MNNKELMAKYQSELTTLNQDAYHQPFGPQIHWQF
jgi:hypothetical protein